MSMLLTEPNFEEWYVWFVDMLKRKPDIAEKNAIRHLVEAQLAKVFEWGEEDCPHVSHSRGKHWCGNCWRALKDS